MKTFNCSGTFSIHMYDIEIEAETEDEARKEFRKICIEDADWYGELRGFICDDVEEENE